MNQLNVFPSFTVWENYREVANASASSLFPAINPLSTCGREGDFFNASSSGPPREEANLILSLHESKINRNEVVSPHEENFNGEFKTQSSPLITVHFELLPFSGEAS